MKAIIPAVVLVAELALSGCPGWNYCEMVQQHEAFPPGGGTISLCGTTFVFEPLPTSRVVVQQLGDIANYSQIRIDGVGVFHFALGRNATQVDPIPGTSNSRGTEITKGKPIAIGDFISICSDIGNSGNYARVEIKDSRNPLQAIPGGIEMQVNRCPS